MSPASNSTSLERPRAVLYARVSTRMQAQDGLSLDVQIREMEEYAAKKEWDVVGKYIDAGISGGSLQRPGIQQLLADMAEDQFDIVIALDSSRLSRDATDFMMLLEKFQKHGIRPVFLQEPEHDISTPEGLLRAQIMASIHEYQRGVTRTKVVASKHQRARLGLHNASTAPYGYKFADSPKSPLIIDEREAEAVRLAFSMYATGRYSFHDVAQELNRRGYRHRPGPRVKSSSSKNHPGRDLTKFTNEGIRDMLGNRFYVGDSVYERMRTRNKKRERKKDGEKKIYQGQHEPIIDRALFDDVQEARKLRTSKPRTYNKMSRIYLINGIVGCTLCKMPLRAQAAKTGQRYYREMSAKKNLDCPYHGIGSKANVIEAQLGIIFSRFNLPKDWLDEVVQAQKTLQDEHAPRDIAKERQTIIRRIDRLTDDYYDGNLEHLGEKMDEFYQKKLRELQAQLDDLPVPSPPQIVFDAESELTKAIDLQTIWEEASMKEKREFMRDSIRSVEVDVSESRVVRLHCYPEFLPIFRNNPLLQRIGEHDFVVRPVSVDDAASLRIETWPALQQTTSPWVVWPYIQQWEGKPPHNMRSTPELSAELSRLRKAGHTGPHVVSLQQSSIPSLMVDPRKWSNVQAQNVILEDLIPDLLSTFPDHSFHVLRTTFPKMEQDAIEHWIQEVARVLHPDGVWLFSTLFIHQMPSHWLHEAFPAYWEHVKSHWVDLWEFKDKLQRQGLKMNLKGARKTIYQSVSIPAASAILDQLVEKDILHRQDVDAFWGRVREKEISAIPSLMVVLNARITHHP